MDQKAYEFLAEYNWPGNIRELENFILRLAALYKEELVGFDEVCSELAHNSKDNVKQSINESDKSLLNETLQQSIHRHLSKYFEAHEGQDLPPTGLYSRILSELEIPLIKLSLEATNGNQIKAAELLGLNRNTLRKKIKELEISVVKKRI